MSANDLEISVEEVSQEIALINTCFAGGEPTDDSKEGTCEGSVDLE